MSDITGIADNEILDEVLKDLDEMEHSRDYWKSKALQYKMDLNGAQRGIRRLKARLKNNSANEFILREARSESYLAGKTDGFGQGYTQAKKENIELANRPF